VHPTEAVIDLGSTTAASGETLLHNEYGKCRSIASHPPMRRKSMWEKRVDNGFFSSSPQPIPRHASSAMANRRSAQPAAPGSASISATDFAPWIVTNSFHRLATASGGVKGSSLHSATTSASASRTLRWA